MDTFLNPHRMKIPKSPKLSRNIINKMRTWQRKNLVLLGEELSETRSADLLSIAQDPEVQNFSNLARYIVPSRALGCVAFGAEMVRFHIEMSEDFEEGLEV